MSDDDSPRARRAARATRTRRRPSLGKINWSKAIGPLVVILLLGGVAGMVYYNATKEAKCPGHWHSTFHVYVHDERMNYDHPSFYMENSGTPMRHHMHQGDGGDQIHWEPRPAQCVEMGDFLRAVGTTLSSDQLVLEGSAHEQFGQAGAYRVGDQNATLKAYITQASSPDWREIGMSSFLDRQPKDGERALVVFGDPSPERLQQMQQGVPVPPAFFDPSSAQHE